MSKTKTCGECKHYIAKMYHCQKNDVMAESFNTCEDFEPQTITNGDHIRQCGNHNFAEYFVYETGAVFASTLIVDKTFDTYEEVVKATEDYLNAPAEREER